MKAEAPVLRARMAVMPVLNRQPETLWFAGFEGVENFGADRS
jgi:hypothetical protein